LFGPRLAIVNPVLWELGRVAWFQERCCLRPPRDGEWLDPWGDKSEAGRADLGGSGRVPVDRFAAGDGVLGCRQMIGSVWEWTSSAFEPYPGFVADPYRKYSEPWFGTHKVPRGGSFSTPARLVASSWRNFYLPDRGDVFAGFRTAAP